MFSRKDKKKDTGLVLLGFSTLMFGMETMSAAVAGMSEVPAFTKLFLLFQNPVLGVLADAVGEITKISLSAFVGDNGEAAALVEPLEKVIDELKEKLRTNKVLRMQKEKCSIEVGFVWSDLLTNLERVSDHCSNIAGCVDGYAPRNARLARNAEKREKGLRGIRQTLRGIRRKYITAAERCAEKQKGKSI